MKVIYPELGLDRFLITESYGRHKMEVYSAQNRKNRKSIIIDSIERRQVETYVLYTEWVKYRVRSIQIQTTVSILYQTIETQILITDLDPGNRRKHNVSEADIHAIFQAWLRAKSRNRGLQFLMDPSTPIYTMYGFYSPANSVPAMSILWGNMRG